MKTSFSQFSQLVRLHTSGLLPLLCFVLLQLALAGCKKDNTVPVTPPVAKVTTVSTAAKLNTPVVLDGSGSASTTSKALSYSWTIKTRPAGSVAVITNSSSAIAGFTPDKPGTYVLVLTVTDSNGASAPVEVTITVDLPGKPPVANAGPSGTVPINRRVALDGSKSSDPDGDKLTYAWAIKSKPTGSAATVLNPAVAVTEFTTDLIGVYVFTLTVSDGIWPAVTAEASITATAPTYREATGSWTAETGTGGGNDYNTPRNHVYTFDVAGNNQPVSLSLISSDINVRMYVFNSLGNEVARSGLGRNVVADVVANAGRYTVVACSDQRYDIGAYTLRGLGLSADFVRVPALRQKAVDVSFGPEGGGGYRNTSRNHYYTFEVTADNSWIDINLQSAQTDVWLSLLGPDGVQIAYNSPGTPRSLLRKLNKGTYGLWASSGSRDDIGKYTLDIFGQVQNLKQTVFDSSILPGVYPGKNGTTTYTLNVTDDNTYLDVSLRSPDVVGYFILYGPTGGELGYTNQVSYGYFIQYVNKGQYKIVVRPGSNTSGIGNYTLSVYGKFSDLKKQ